MIVNIFLFLGGVGFIESAVLVVILAIGGFFVWRALLKYLVSKGSRGINIAAIIMGVFQAPVLVAIIISLILVIASLNERRTSSYEPGELSVEEAAKNMQAYQDSLDKMMMTRIAKLTIDANKLEEYKSALIEEITASKQNEPGVINLFAVFDKKNPTSLTILEIYADSSAYTSHLKTPHFLKYKTETKEMVKALELMEVVPLPGMEFY